MPFDSTDSLSIKMMELLDRATGNFRIMMHDMGPNSACESPIERLLSFVFFANESVPSYNETAMFYKCENWNYPSHHSNFDDIRRHHLSDNTVHVFSQVQIENYRADFLCVQQIKPVDRPFKVQYLAIECDGHEFHEKTKEQAARDKLRDRVLLLHGIPCMRFTGSEIWKDTYACLRQIDIFFLKSSYRYLMDKELDEDGVMGFYWNNP